MIEVLKQALEALEKERPYLGAMPTLTSKAITSLQQAIKDLESQEPVAWIAPRYEGGHENLEVVDEREFGAFRVYTHPPQRKPLTDGDFLDWYDSAIWGNEDFKQCCQIAFEAGWQFAHGIKE